MRGTAFSERTQRPDPDYSYVVWSRGEREKMGSGKLS